MYTHLGWRITQSFGSFNFKNGEVPHPKKKTKETSFRARESRLSTNCVWPKDSGLLLAPIWISLVAAALSLLILQDVRAMVLYASWTKGWAVQQSTGLVPCFVQMIACRSSRSTTSLLVLYSFNRILSTFASCELVELENDLELVFGLDMILRTFLW